MKYLPVEVRRFVSQRATGRCEYCGLSQEGQEARFHIDHIVPVVAGGQTTAENLALACVSCSLRKAARQTAIDPQTGGEVALYNPRREQWAEHFRWGGRSLGWPDDHWTGYRGCPRHESALDSRDSAGRSKPGSSSSSSHRTRCVTLSFQSE